MTSDKIKELEKLDFEKIISFIFIFASVLEIIGNEYQQNFIITNNKRYKTKSNNIFITTLIITIIIYFYFLYRNISEYNYASDNDKELYSLRVISTILLIIGTILILYFQIKNTSFFLGDPAL